MSPTDPYPMKTLGSLEANGTNGHAPPAAFASAIDSQAPPPALSAPPSLEAAGHILRRRWQLIVSLGLVASLLGAAVAAYFTPAKYSTSAIVHLSSRNLRGGYTEADEFLNFQRTQMAELKGYDVLTRLLAKPEIRELNEMQSHQGSEMEWLQKELVIDTQMGPEILRLTLSGDHPEDIEKILNTLIAVYKEKFDSEDLDKINRQIESLRTRLKETEKEIQNNSNLPEGPGRDLKTLEQRQQDLQTNLTMLGNQIWLLRREIRSNEEDKAGLERKKSRPELLVDDYELRKEVSQNDQIRPLRDLIREKDLEIVKWERAATKPTPKTIQDSIDKVKAEKAILEKEIALHSGGAMDTVRGLLEKRELQRLNDRIAEVDKKIALGKKDEEDCRRELLTAQTARDEVTLQIFNQRNREDRMRDAFLAKEMVMKKLAEDLSTLEAGKSAPSRVEFKERALVPTGRKLDKKIKFAGGAALTLFVLVGMGVFLYEFNERRVYSQQEVARGLGLKVIGTLPYQHSRLSATAEEQFAMLESADALRTVLLQAGRQDGVRIVMVTSAGNGEGKTSLACQLAASLGRAGRRTLLIDGDLRNPAAHGQFNLPLTPGLAEALRGEIDPDEAIKPTNVAHLSLLPAGQCDPAAIQALAQDEVQTLFYHLKENYEFVILDVSPVLPVADALVIGQHADAVLFSVLREVSKLPLVYEAQQRLAALGIRLLGAVVSGERGRIYYGGRALSNAKTLGRN